MKKRIINILLYFLKKLGYNDVFKSTTIVNISDFQRLDFKYILEKHTVISKDVFEIEQSEFHNARRIVIEQVSSEIAKYIRCSPVPYNPSQAECSLTIYIKP